MPGAALKVRANISALLLATALAAAPSLASAQGDEPGSFDFYVLSLSWSPSFCAAEGEGANPRQCGADKSFAFIVHGLWPQYESGWPEYCESDEPQRVPDDLVDDYLDLMPSPALIGHQWRKHGTCTGMEQEDYFAFLRKARERVIVPAELAGRDAASMVSPDLVEQRFLAANPDLDPDEIAVTCDQRFLREVRICMTEDLTFRACREVDERSCKSERALMPPAR